MRITLPLGTPLVPGTRLIVGQDSPIKAPFLSCLTDCTADHEVDADLAGQLKSTKQLAVQGIHSNDQPFSIVFPTADFGSVRDRLLSDTRVLENYRASPSSAAGTTIRCNGSCGRRDVNRGLHPAQAPHIFGGPHLVSMFQ